MRIGTRFRNRHRLLCLCTIFYFTQQSATCSVDIIPQMSTSLIKSYYKVIILSLYVTKFGAETLIDGMFMPQKRNSKWRPPPSCIYFRWLFLTYCQFPLLNATIIQNFMNISQSTTQLCYLFKFNMAPVRHVGFSNTWPIYQRTLLIFHYYTKFVAIILTNAQIMSQNRNSKWRPPPSWIYFLWQFLRYCRLYTITVNQCAKFRVNVFV